jgi:hypothetical protein
MHDHADLSMDGGYDSPRTPLSWPGRRRAGLHASGDRAVSNDRLFYVCQAAFIAMAAALSVRWMRPGQVAFDATTNFPVRTTLGAALLHVPAGFAIMGHPDDRDHVQGTVQGPVTAPVQPVPDSVPGGCGDRIYPGQGGKCCLVTDPALVRPRGETLRGADRPEPRLLQ